MPEHTRPARGMRDFLPEDVRRRDYVIAVVKDVYARYGFEPLETPALENIDTLLRRPSDAAPEQDRNHELRLEQHQHGRGQH